MNLERTADASIHGREPAFFASSYAKASRCQAAFLDNHQKSGPDRFDPETMSVCGRDSLVLRLSTADTKNTARVQKGLSVLCVVSCSPTGSPSPTGE